MTPARERHHGEWVFRVMATSDELGALIVETSREFLGASLSLVLATGLRVIETRR